LNGRRRRKTDDLENTPEVLRIRKFSKPLPKTPHKFPSFLFICRRSFTPNSSDIVSDHPAICQIVICLRHNWSTNSEQMVPSTLQIFSSYFLFSSSLLTTLRHTSLYTNLHRQ